MHDYSLDTPVRRYVDVGIAVISLSLPTLIAKSASLISAPPLLTFPISFGATFALFYFLFDEYLWRRCRPLHKIPDLNGDWLAEGTSSYREPGATVDHKFSMRLKIRQTF